MERKIRHMNRELVYKFVYVNSRHLDTDRKRTPFMV